MQMIAETINPLEQLAVESDHELESLFRDCRSGPYGAFFFSHGDAYPMLSVLLHESLAYVHYFPAEGGSRDFIPSRTAASRLPEGPRTSSSRAATKATASTSMRR